MLVGQEEPVMNPYFDLSKTPFSCRGSYVALSHYEDGVHVRTVSRMVSVGTMCRLVPLVDGVAATFRVEMEAAEVRFVTEAGVLRVCFGDAETLLVRGASARVGVMFDFSQPHGIPSFGNDVPYGGRMMRMFTCHGSLCRMLLDVRSGVRTDEQDWDGRGATYSRTTILPEKGGFLFASLREIRTEWDRVVPEWDYEEALAVQRGAFRDFEKGFAAAPAGLEASRELAAYVLWSCCVRPYNALKREAMLMSKNWMTQVWSWDHCFNAIAMAGVHPEMAWDQWVILFDFQDSTGVIPDSISDVGGLYTFCKPPIHGWALERMLERMELTKEQLCEAYDRLSLWTWWWLQFRDRDQNGLCEYDHGNDSGWDNSTVFQFQPPVETPDLQAFLVKQMEVLGKVAQRLGRSLEAKEWGERSQGLLERMCERCFDGEGRPLVRQVNTGKVASPDSLLLYVPVILGQRLPERIRECLVRELKGDRFLTEWGLATESPKSAYYQADGYWLGPIWAPAMMLVMDGLKACGEGEYAAELARRFQKLFARGGSAENFDALTGECHNDPAYTWASAVFLSML